MDISRTKVVIATHSLVYGAPQALREYLMLENVKELLFISHPLQIDGSRSTSETIIKGKSSKTQTSRLRTKTPILNYIIESVLTFRWVFNKKTTYDLYVGVDPLNCGIGVILKKRGKVKKLVYYTIDYVPKRFLNRVLNNIYHHIDKLCVSNADETWNVSNRIAEGREKIRGLSRKTYNKQKVVPIGVWIDRVKRLPFGKIKKNQLLFVGNLLEKQGVQIVLDSIPDIVKKLPDFHFLVVGGGEYESTLKQKVKMLKLEKHVTFTGWIKEREKLDTIMADSAVAIAMYDKKKDTFTYYADPTKLKDYLSAGLPVLLTEVPFNAHDLEKNNCGIIIRYDKQDISKAVITILKDQETLKIYRQNSVSYVSQFGWSKIFAEALKQFLQ